LVDDLLPGLVGILDSQFIRQDSDIVKLPNRQKTQLSLSLLLLLIGQTNALGPGDQTRSLEVDKRSRTYLLHVPKSYARSKPFPVILAFQGSGGNAEQMVR
jgi:poly(3-hydroxybutyrate) depolymerase